MCQNIGKHFYYRGCGWKKKHVEWTEADKEWIYELNDLLDKIDKRSFEMFQFLQPGKINRDFKYVKSTQARQCFQVEVFPDASGVIL